MAAQAACKIYADITSTSRDWVNEVTASDLTPTAVEMARRHFELEGVRAEAVQVGGG